MNTTVEHLGKVEAKFSQSRNDLYWSHHDLKDGFIRWTGYDDAYWWSNKAFNEAWATRIGPKTGRIFTLNPDTNEVFITRAIADAKQSEVQS